LEDTQVVLIVISITPQRFIDILVNLPRYL
jgi:hypothetical protein